MFLKEDHHLEKPVLFLVGWGQGARGGGEKRSGWLQPLTDATF